jgi:FG-GAP-like repeat
MMRRSRVRTCEPAGARDIQEREQEEDMRARAIVLVMASASASGCVDSLSPESQSEPEEQSQSQSRTQEIASPGAAIGQIYDQFLLHAGTSLSIAEDGLGDFTMADVDLDGRPDLVYVKRRGTPTGRIEVHVQSAASGFRQRIVTSSTAFLAAEDSFGNFAMADIDLDGRPDLVFIKQRVTGTASVEVHAASAASGFQQFIMHSASSFTEIEDTSGDFRMADVNLDRRPDLVFIKRRATPTGKIEVHAASGATGFQQRIIATGSALLSAEDGLGSFAMTDVDRDGRPDLVYFKQPTTASGKVEVHVLSAASGFQQFLQHAVSALPAIEGGFGDFALANFNGDLRLDLVFIKRRKTPTGVVEVHVLGG